MHSNLGMPQMHCTSRETSWNKVGRAASLSERPVGPHAANKYSTTKTTLYRENRPGGEDGTTSVQNPQCPQFSLSLSLSLSLKKKKNTRTTKDKNSLYNHLASINTSPNPKKKKKKNQKHLDKDKFPLKQKVQDIKNVEITNSGYEKRWRQRITALQLPKHKTPI